MELQNINIHSWFEKQILNTQIVYFLFIFKVSK